MAAGRCVVADFLRHLQPTERRSHAAPAIANAESGSRDRKDRSPLATLDNHEFLITHADDDARRDWCVWTGEKVEG